MSELKSYLKIKTAISVSAANDKIATIIHKGDKNNGSIILKLRRHDSKSCLLGKSLSHKGSYEWSSLFQENDVWIDENIVNEKILKERKIDPDVWVLELETDTFWNPLEEI